MMHANHHLSIEVLAPLKQILICLTHCTLTAFALIFDKVFVMSTTMLILYPHHSVGVLTLSKLRDLLSYDSVL
jgi:hypothetical protein